MDKKKAYGGVTSARLTARPHHHLFMKLLMHLAKLFIGEVCVNLSGGDGGVTKHVLNGTEVRTAKQQIGGERMADGVGRDFFYDNKTDTGASYQKNNTRRIPSTIQLFGERY